MRSNVFFTASMLFAVMASSATAEFDTTDCKYLLPVCAEQSPYFFAATEYLSWKASQPGNDFAVSESGNALIVGDGDVHRATLDTDSGFRAQIGYMTSTGWSVSGSYTYFDADGTARADRPAGAGQLFATRSHPDGNLEADTATGFTSLDYNVFDLVFRRSVNQTAFSDLRVFGGVRWASIDQLLRTELDGRDFNDAVIENTTSVNAAGIRVGSDTTWRLAKGFFLYGQASGGLLFAESSTQQVETDFSGTDLLVNLNDQRDRSLPFLDTRLGIGWSRKNISVTAGYELENWFGLQDRSLFVDNVHEGAFASVSDDIMLSGFFLRMTVQH